MVSSTRRTAGCGPACPVVWEGRTGNRLPYPDCHRILSLMDGHGVPCPYEGFEAIGSLETGDSV